MTASAAGGGRALPRPDRVSGESLLAMAPGSSGARTALWRSGEGPNDGRWTQTTGQGRIARPLTGFGFGSLGYVFPACRSSGCMPLDWGHNGYLEWAMGLGLP